MFINNRRVDGISRQRGGILMEKNLNLKVAEATFAKDGKTVDYVSCTAVVNGILLKFYPADNTAKQIIKDYLKGGK